jgi:EpsI family protein
MCICLLCHVETGCDWYLHRPEFRYAGNGFEVLDAGEDSVDIGGDRLAVERLIAAVGSRREPLTYWITMNNTVTPPGIDHNLEQIRYGFRDQTPDGLLIRISSIGISDVESSRLQDEFLNALSGGVDPSIRQ